MFTCNATGSDKLNPLIIGTAENPRCFRNFRKDLYCDYHYNKKGWMNRKVFQDFLTNFNAQVRCRNRKVLLLVDNAPGHIVPKAGLSNVEVFFLTPNLTSHIQPLDAGIIATFKRRYRSKQIRKLVEAIDIQRPLKGAINLANAIRIAGESWRG